MEEQHLEPHRYRPAEVAKRLGITTQTLSQWRRDGKIQGIEDKNITWYTDEQIANAQLARHKPGPKVGEGSRLGRAKYSWTDDDKDASLGHRWRVSEIGDNSLDCRLIGA